MTDVDTNEPPLFDLDARREHDPAEAGDFSIGGPLVLEGVEIPADLKQHGNGTLPSQLLAPAGIGGHRLHPAAAAAFARWREAARGAGIDLTMTDSYRSFEQQVDAKKRKPQWSATPGRSVHGWGLAVDLSIGMPPKPFGPSVLTWLKDNGPPLHWHLGRPKDEPWHWVYRGPLGDHVSEPAAAQSAVALPADASLPELRGGASGEHVRRLQALLGIAADGQFGPQTEQAVRDFQQRAGLAVDGCCGPSTWAALNASTAPAERPELRIGSTGDAVRWLQTRLGLTSDGEFGQRTDAAVKAFQTSCGLTADGLVGPRTWAALTAGT
jgi:peptidoglycan hydrolase-like protein with peptidoglycan-binding domain